MDVPRIATPRSGCIQGNRTKRVKSFLKTAVAMWVMFARRSTITGTNGPDTLFGTGFDDSISALDGDDFVNAGAGNDSVSDGLGNDDLRGLDGNDTLCPFTLPSSLSDWDFRASA